MIFFKNKNIFKKYYQTLNMTVLNHEDIPICLIGVRRNHYQLKAFLFTFFSQKKKFWFYHLHHPIITITTTTLAPLSTHMHPSPQLIYTQLPLQLSNKPPYKSTNNYTTKAPIQTQGNMDKKTKPKGIVGLCFFVCQSFLILWEKEHKCSKFKPTFKTPFPPLI